MRSFQLHVDLLDKGDYVELSADLPGFSKEDIKIDIDGDNMSIEARKEENLSHEDKSYICRERRCGSFMRRFDISNIKASEIAGSYKDGVLTLTLPKKDAAIETKRRLELG